METQSGWAELLLILNATLGVAEYFSNGWHMMLILTALSYRHEPG